jgi:uncharacterized membrane protein
VTRTRSTAGRRFTLDLVFRWGVVAKGVYGIGEVLAGVFLVVVSPSSIQNWADVLTQQRLSDDPDDPLSLGLVHLVNGLTSSALTFAAVYLFVHGLVKIGLLVAVVTHRYRAYPWAIGMLVAFIGYQSYELIVHYSLGLSLLTVFDAIIVALTWREYRGRAATSTPTDSSGRNRRGMGAGDAESDHSPGEAQPDEARSRDIARAGLPWCE